MKQKINIINIYSKYQISHLISQLLHALETEVLSKRKMEKLNSKLVNL